MTKFKQAIGASAAVLAILAAKTCSKVGMIASHGGGALVGEEAARIAPVGMHALEQGGGAMRPLGHIDDLGAASRPVDDATAATGAGGGHSADDAAAASKNNSAHSESEPWYHETGREVLKEGADAYMRWNDQQRDGERQNQTGDVPSIPGYVRPDPEAP